MREKAANAWCAWEDAVVSLEPAGSPSPYGGRLDLGGPLDTAWDLAQAWPDARLFVIDEAGHLGSDRTRARVLDALDRFARQRATLPLCRRLHLRHFK